MPDATFLHIQGSDDSPTRVIELPVGPIRVGRGPLCEVRLADPGLGDVQCMLRRRGATWHYQPVGPPGRVSIDGRPADVQRPIAIGDTLRVGDHRLTLRNAGGSAEARGSFATPISVEPNGSVETEPARKVDVTPPPVDPTRTQASTEDAEAERLRRWQSRLDQREQWQKDRRDEKRWEARWKAAGESIRARSSESPSAPRVPERPTPAPPTPRTPQSPPPGRPVEPRTLPTFQRIAEPRPRPPETRVPLRPTTRPATISPPVEVVPVRVEPPAPTTRAMVALAPPTIERPEPKIEAEILPTILVPAPLAVEAIEPPTSTILATELPVQESESLTPTIDAKSTLEEAAEREPILVDSTEIAVEPSEIEAGSGPSPQADPDLLAAHQTLQGSEEFEPGQIETTAEASALEAPFERDFTTIELPSTIDEPALPSRPTSFESPGLSEPIEEAAPPERVLPNAEWPSARSIFAAHQKRGNSPKPVPSPTVRRRSRSVEPTDSRGPECWTIPGWLGWFPSSIATLCVGAVGLLLCYEWTVDASSANLAMTLATRDEKSTGPRIDPDLLPKGGWWRSTAPHRAAWAMALARAADGEDHLEEYREMADAARHASPLGSITRFAIQPPAPREGDPANDLSALAGPRSVVMLTWTGRKLRQVGKVEASLKAYRSALAMASRTRAADLDRPAYDDDPQIRRFALPRESVIGTVVADMARAGEWGHEQWVDVLPDSATAPLVAARVLLKLQNRGEADRLSDLAISRADAAFAPNLDPAEHRAAVAEALAYRTRWTDASEQYRRAIDLAAEDGTRRSWWLNLAEIAQRTSDDATRAKALEAARAGDSSDPISLRALEYQQGNPGLATRSDRR